MSNDTIAGSGLEKMFYGQILSILVIIPLVGWIAASNPVAFAGRPGPMRATAPPSMWRSAFWC